MKQVTFFTILLSFIAFTGCKKTDVTATTTLPVVTSYTLTVDNGTGSGMYNSGDSAYIFSNSASSTQVFDKWTGDVSALASPNEWRTTLKMPAANVNITATYKAVPAINFTNVTINGSQVYYYVPASYRGIILPFHGAGGNATGWTSSNLENVEFCRYAAANGYALVITESKDRVNKTWDNSATSNVDIANIDIILNSLQTSSIIANKPLYGVGMSQGSGFCSLITYLKNYKAGALYCVPGISQVFDVSNVPVIWNMALKDVTEDPNRLTSATTNYNKLLARSIPASYYVNQPTPVYPSRFTIIPGVDLAGSTAIYNALKAAGHLDAKGFFTIDPRLSSSWQSAIPPPYNTAAFVPHIEDQMYVCFTQHKFFKDSNFRTIEFFNRF
jgi:Divergent InlB B-repeat domain